MPPNAWLIGLKAMGQKNYTQGFTLTMQAEMCK
jgi:hypothetical protein